MSSPIALRLPQASLALLIVMIAASCRMYEWRDEPCIRPVVADGSAAAIEDLRSGGQDDRTIACRALGQLAAEAIGRGDADEARRIAKILMDHFAKETSHQVRSVILALALRDIGHANEDVKAFVLARLAADELPVAAAYTLAVLRPPGTFEAIHRAVLRHEPEQRYELLQALWLLGDPRANAVFAGQLQQIDQTWPDQIHHMDKAQYRQVLLARAKSLPRNNGETSAPAEASSGAPTR